MSFDRVRHRMSRPWGFRLYLLHRVPLAALAGLRLEKLDAEECRVSLPGGWRNRNPFGSTYFASQAMAAEASTGAPALALVASAPVSISPILREVHGSFLKKIVGPSLFVFSDVAAMRETVERAAASPDSQAFRARSTARDREGDLAAEFELVWSFKRRS